MSAHPCIFTPSKLRAHGHVDGRLRYMDVIILFTQFSILCCNENENHYYIIIIKAANVSCRFHGTIAVIAYELYGKKIAKVNIFLIFIMLNYNSHHHLCNVTQFH